MRNRKNYAYSIVYTIDRTNYILFYTLVYLLCSRYEPNPKRQTLNRAVQGYYKGT